MNKSREIKRVIQYFINLNQKGIISDEELKVLVAQHYAEHIELKFNNSLNKTFNRFERRFEKALVNA